MAKDAIRINVNGKVMQKEPLDGLIVKGELNAAKIEFTLDRYVNGIDLADGDMTYEVWGANSAGQSAHNDLVKSEQSTPDKLVLVWTVGQQFTAAAFTLKIWINIKKNVGGKVTLNWSTEPLRIKVHDGFVISEYVSVTDQLLVDLGTYLSQAQAAAAAAGNSAGQATTSEVNAKQSAIDAEASKISANEIIEAGKISLAEIADDAEASALKSAGSASDSQESADAAALSATESAESAEDSQNSAIAAKASQDASAINADLSEMSAQSAQSFAEEAQRIKDSTEMEYDVQETRVGFKRKDEYDFTYTEDLTGPAGPQGVRGLQGPQGEKGDKGDRGETGLTMLADGLFLFYVTTDGFLICRYDDNSEPPSFKINESGNLIWEAKDPVITP